MNSQIPFHLVGDAEWESIKGSGMTWDELAEKHPQPSWCSYPHALRGTIGCWSLVGRMVNGEDYCKSCDE